MPAAQPTVVGYSGTPLAKKLGIFEGAQVALIRAPDGIEGLLAPLPAGVKLRRSLGSGADVILFFTMSRRSLENRIDRLKSAISPDKVLWVAWPKKAAKVATDMTEDVVREVALPTGLVDVKVCAIDETWSGLKLVVRRSLRYPAGN